MVYVPQFALRQIKDAATPKISTDLHDRSPNWTARRFEDPGPLPIYLRRRPSWTASAQIRQWMGGGSSPRQWRARGGRDLHVAVGDVWVEVAASTAGAAPVGYASKVRVWLRV